MLRRRKLFTIMLFGLLVCGNYLFNACTRCVRTFLPVQEEETEVDYTCDLMEIPKFTVSRPEQVIEHLGFTLSYNPQWRIPNWVAYEITREETYGETPRENNFDPDPKVKGVCPVSRDYSNSGYDRGHMAPAADMKWSPQAMEESFYLTNICPQNQNLNRGDWNSIEIKVRKWAKQFGSVYVVCGPIVCDNPKTIGQNDVAVPDAFFKVCLAKINGEWQAIGFVCDNEAGHRKLNMYCRTIDEVEEITGMDFFSNLDDSVEDYIEARFNATVWGL